MPARVWILWLLFLVRGAFYCQLLPLWEGWDEYAHAAWIQHWIATGTIPRLSDNVSREIDESLRVAPLPAELRWIGPPYLTHEQWWALPEFERDQRRAALRAIRPAWANTPAAHYFQAYEAQQPPLYYWILSLPARAAAAWPIEKRVQLLRLLSVLLASLCIPLTWLLAKEILPDALRLLPPAILAAAPGLAIDIARVGNDALMVPATAALAWLLARRQAHGGLAGAALGAALLAKATALALLPAIIVLWWRKSRRELAIALTVAAAIAGWWYARNLLLELSLTGWLADNETRHVVSGLSRVAWLSAADVEAKSFLWFGGWSFLTLKSWMYRIPEAMAAIAAIGLIVRRPPRLIAPITILVFAFIAYSWGILVDFASQGISNIPGWYLWAFAPAMCVLFTAGLGRAAWILIAVFALLDVYGPSTIMAPYYAGLVEHNRAALSMFPQAVTRIGLSWPLVTAWIVSTLAVPALAWRSAGWR
jgi:hypothetical protein